MVATAPAGLAEIPTDIYWELDARLRFVVFTGRALAPAGIEPAEVLGKTPWQHGTFLEDPWAAHRATLRAHRPFDEFVYRCLNSSSEVRYLSSSGRPVFDENGAFLGYRGTAKDISAHMRMALRLSLEHSVARVLEAAQEIGPAMTEVVRIICDALGWACGTRRVGTSEGLRCAETWGIEAPGIAEFLAATREHVPSRSAGGLARGVWAEGTPRWIPDVTREPTFHRGALARDCGLRSAFAFPIRTDGEVTGVMEFFSRGEYQPDSELLDCMTYIGAQLGQFLQRKHADAVLRESEGRFRSLTRLSSDFYWETDAGHRLLATRHGSDHRPLFKDAGHIGKRRWELPSAAPDAAGWEAHRATLERHEPFRDFEFARIDVAGLERWLSISGEPTFDAAGAFTGYRGVGKDITERKRDTKLLNLEHTVARCLAEAPDVPAGLRGVLHAVCQAKGWDCGRYFRKDEAAVFRYAGYYWHVGGAALERFIEYSQGRAFPLGKGIVGIAGAGEPVWTADIGRDPRIASRALAHEHGMRGAFMFPVLAEGEVIGVLSFTSREIREPDERLLRTARVIGSLVGQFIQRKQAEEVLRESEERFRMLTKASSDWYWEQDADLRFVSIGQAIVGKTGISADKHLGKRRWDLPALNLSEADWAAHRAVCEAHQPFHDFEICRIAENGRPSWVMISGEPIFDADGRFRGYRGVGKDITPRKRAEQLRSLEHSVTRALAEANSVVDVIRSAIRAVCETEGWACGRYFAPDEKSGELRLSVSWGVDNADVRAFLEASRSIGYGPGRGLAGRVWLSSEPVWVEDLAKDARVEHGRLAIVGGIRAAFVFPVVADGKTIGVLAFNSREPRPPEESFLQAIRVIGIQIGQFVQRKQAEEVLRESEERFRSLTSLSSDVYWEQDAEFRFTTFTGTGSEHVKVADLPIGKRRWEQEYVNVTPEAWVEHISLLQAHKPFRDMELCRLDEKGGKVWVSVSGEPVFDAAGHFRGYRGVGKDITPRKLAEERIQYLANHDALTGLPNRAMFAELVNHSIQNARRYRRSFAVLFVDLDRFKVINDTLGHEAGDRVLKDVAASLSRTLRSSDVVARLGGDEFVILVQEVSEPQQVEAVARKILAVLARPIYLNGEDYRVTASIGICMYPSDAQDEQTVMKHADIAMYRAKEEGKNTYRFYSQKANSHSFERLALETSLRRGLERNEFLLHYQPKVDVRSGRITGVEALIRWQHPELGMVPPAQFIPLAEETGLIVPLGKWVLRAACAQSVAWQRSGLPPVRMSVNISARQFGDEKLLEDIGAALEASGLEPELLELELTESMVMQDADSAATVLAAIRKMGVHLAIDDFGVGYSSLAQLKRFPIDTLKVDRSFIRDIPQDADDTAIAEAIIAIGKRLKLTIVAEGVETLEQQAFLKEHDCDEMQGYIFSKPLPGTEFAELLRNTMKARG